MNSHHWARLLTYVSGLVNQKLLLQLEYLAAENRILRAHLPNRLPLTNDQRSTLAEIGKRLGRKGLEKIVTAANRKRFSAWFRKLVAQKFDGSKYRLYPGRPATSSEVVNLIVQLARENSSWGYDRIAGALTVEVLTWRGLVTYYVLFLIQPETRKVILAGITRHPTEEWMQQLAQNLTDSESGALIHQRYKGVSVEADPI